MRGEEVLSSPGMLEMDCTISAVYPAGDHDLVLANVCRVSTSHGYPIVYWREGFHALQPNYSFLISREAFERFTAARQAGTLPKASGPMQAPEGHTDVYPVAVCEDPISRLAQIERLLIGDLRRIGLD